jgi:formamidopyrimidine-DNA glycosylase
LPELPEVETLKNDLHEKIRGKRIVEVTIRSGRVIRRNPSRESLKRSLLKKKIIGLKRRGKALLLFLDSGEVLVIRLGMTGQITLSHVPGWRADKHTHFILTLDDGSRLQFKDVRQFGQVFVTPRKEVEESLQMGPEPLHDDFRLSHLKQILNSPSRIKTLLMDQKKIAGIGNIYSDEILFAARINPLRPARLLSTGEIKKLYHSIRQVLKEGIKRRGTTIRDFRDGFGRQGSYQHDLRVYQRKGQACLVCKTPIERMMLSGRSCHFCPCCQN